MLKEIEGSLPVRYINMPQSDQFTLIKNNKTGAIRDLYDRYAGMLLGYIYEVVNDRKTAEEYLIKVFADVSTHYNEQNLQEINKWFQLRNFARERLALYNGRLRVGNAKIGSAYLGLLNDEQKIVFCDTYYHGKSVETIALELKQTEDSIRKTLKEAFCVIRKSSEN